MQLNIGSEPKMKTTRLPGVTRRGATKFWSATIDRYTQFGINAFDGARRCPDNFGDARRLKGRIDVVGYLVTALGRPDWRSGR
jgi:hypothetical protein